MPARILPFRSPDPFAAHLSERRAEEARALQTRQPEPTDRDHSHPYSFWGSGWAWFERPHDDDFNPGGSAA